MKVLELKEQDFSNHKINHIATESFKQLKSVWQQKQGIWSGVKKIVHFDNGNIHKMVVKNNLVSYLDSLIYLFIINVLKDLEKRINQTFSLCERN